jgi:hypothetical protein
MGPKEFQNAKLYIKDAETGEEIELATTGKIEVKETPESKKFMELANCEGTLHMDCKNVEMPGFIEARRLFNILKSIRKTRTKKKLFNRIYATTAGRLYLQGKGVK